MIKRNNLLMYVTILKNFLNIMLNDKIQSLKAMLHDCINMKSSESVAPNGYETSFGHDETMLE